MRSFEVTKTETPKTEPQKPRVKNSLIDSPHPNLMHKSSTRSLRRLFRNMPTAPGSQLKIILLYLSGLNLMEGKLTIEQ